MKNLIILTIILVFAFKANCQTKEFIFKGRQDTVPVTMLVSNKFGTDEQLYVNDTIRYAVANVYQIRGFEVLPEHSQPFYLDENKKPFEPNVFFIIWQVFAYNYHYPNK